MKSSRLSLAWLFLGGANLLAVPASPDPVEITQPDGSVFAAYVRGDEFQGWVETAEGYTIVRNEATGAWEYAATDAQGNLASSGVPVQPNVAPDAKVPLHLMPPRKTEIAIGDWKTRNQEPGALVTMAPVSGTRKLLILLVQFADRSLVTTPSGWNGTTFNTTPGAKSLANFYTDNSFGALTVSPVAHTQTGNPAGIVTVTVSMNHPNSGNNWNYSVEIAWINAALAQAAPYVNFPALDTDGDGVLETSEVVIYFILAGYEASGSSKTPNIWAHAWGGSGVSVSGKQLRTWALNGELNNADAQHPMGVIAHELGHSMCGLPDLYDTTYTNSGLGVFSLMAFGSWGRTASESYGGTTPVALDAWSRQYLGWAAPRIPAAPGAMSFGPALSSPDAPVKLINTTVSTTQFFLVENRHSSGWDKGMEPWLGANWGGGLLIQHIDTTIGTVNQYVSGSHQGVMAEEASTAYCSLVTPGTTCRGHVTLLFYSGNNPGFGDATTPNTRLYNGTPTGLAVTGISARSQTMTATVDVPAPVVLANVSAISVPENGAATFLVKLGMQPASNVTVSVAPIDGDADITVQSGASLTFTSSNWNTYQAVTLAAANDDDAIDGTTTIRCSAPGWTGKDVTATEADDDRVIVTDVGSLTVPETGTAAFQVRLRGRPAADVIVSVAFLSGDTDIAIQSGAGLTFTPTDWNLYQSVTLAAAHDPDRANGRATIRCSAAGWASCDVLATENDDEVPADYNFDGDVDLNDFGLLQLCLDGPNRPLRAPECAAADMDGDEDVDLADLSTFQDCFNGPNRPPACR